MAITQKIIRHLEKVLAKSSDSTLEDVIKEFKKQVELRELASEFETLLKTFRRNEKFLPNLFKHPIGQALREFFRCFPVGYLDAHAHLSGSLHSSFLLPKVLSVLSKDRGEVFAQHIERVYGKKAAQIQTEEDIDNLLCGYDTLSFKDFLIKGLYLPKLILLEKQTHIEAAEHIATTFYQNFNIRHLRLKFTLSRTTGDSFEQVPHSETMPFEDVILGLYEGFKRFQQLHTDFKFTLSPSFRKEEEFFDAKNFKNKQEHFEFLVDKLLEFLDKNPFLKEHVNEVDTVGNELYFYKEEHFLTWKRGVAKLKANNFKVRSHHGEIFFTLLEAVRCIGFAITIWKIDTLEHGLAAGVNPFLYFGRLKKKVFAKNALKQAIDQKEREFFELRDLAWDDKEWIFEKLLRGEELDQEEKRILRNLFFDKIKEVWDAQVEVLCLLLEHNVSITSIPTTNKKLTGLFNHYKEHPFPFWSSLGIKMNIGSDDYYPNNSDFIQEMLILLFANFETMQINFLLMCATNSQNISKINQILEKSREQENQK